MDRYTARMSLRGTTQRERAKNRFKQHLNDRLPNSLSYKNILLNGTETQLIINSGTQTYYKEFQSLPDQIINIGDYIEWANSHWIVIACDSDSEVYRDGKLQQCNYLLKWQNELGKIIERWAVIQSASKYNDGTNSNNIITLGSDQLSVIIPLDEESIKLKKSMGKKFFIDNNKKDPTTYELTGTGNVPDTYNGYGITSWIVKECAYTPSQDDLKYGVCDYKPFKPPTSFFQNETTVLNAIIKGNPSLKVGFARTYTVIFTDKNDNELDWNNVGFTWNVTSKHNIKQNINGNEIEFLVEDNSLVGESFLLSVANDNGIMAKIKITVVEGF